MSLKCMIDKWLHKGQISQEEYDAVIKKLDGHDKQIKSEVLDEFETRILGNCSLTLKDGEKVIVIRQDIFQFISEQMQKGQKNE